MDNCPCSKSLGPVRKGPIALIPAVLSPVSMFYLTLRTDERFSQSRPPYKVHLDSISVEGLHMSRLVGLGLLSIMNNDPRAMSVAEKCPTASERLPVLGDVVKKS